MIEYKLIRELDKNPYHTKGPGELAWHKPRQGKLRARGPHTEGHRQGAEIKKPSDNIRWKYILTPKGIREKIRITQNYLHTRLEEFDQIRREIEELKNEIGCTPPEIKIPWDVFVNTGKNQFLFNAAIIKVRRRGKVYQDEKVSSWQLPVSGFY